VAIRAESLRILNKNFVPMPIGTDDQQKVLEVVADNLSATG
jgi:hypothetical protein